VGNKSVFGSRPEDDPRGKVIREAIRRRDAKPEPRLSWKQRDPGGWAREQLLKWRDDVLERRREKSSG
jgi:hypothetical protein